MRRLGAPLVLALGVAAAPVTASWLLERTVFQPTRGVDLRPEEVGVEGEEVFLRAEDGVRLHAFFLPAPGASRALFHLHGNAGNASHRLPLGAELVRLGAHVLLLDYRGYGRSEGRPSETGVYADARAALAHLREARGLPESRIVVFGSSLGGAVAVDLARDRPLAGLVLESTFTSLADAARGVLGPLAPLLVRGRFASDRKIARVRCPLLFLHGERDTLVDPRLGRRLFELAPEPKRFEAIPGAGHNDLVEIGGRAYFARIGRFLEEVAPVGGR
jgi:hypothetical protein